jgi:hypothetical protein
MKNKLKALSILVIAIAFTQTLTAQTASKSSPPSDALAGFTYDFNKAQNLILERITSPNKTNADAQVFLDQPDFPALGKGKTVDTGYKDQLKLWMEKNPNLIINTLKSRTDIVTQY